jgi:4-hydroxy-3-methylbut-2-en-1-yl diphosphate synthase IspG/GcpE
VGGYWRHHPRSLSAEPEEEVRVGYEMLKALGLRHRGVNIISPPVLRASAVRRDPPSRRWKSASSHHHADDRAGDRLP